MSNSNKMGFTYIDIDFQDYHFAQLFKLYQNNDEFIASFLNEFTNTLANVLSDYLIMIVYGEGRYALTKSSYNRIPKLHFVRYIEDEHYKCYNEDLKREDVYYLVKKAIKYKELNKKKIIEDFERLKGIFNNCTWNADFGGYSWAKITKICLHYLKKEISKVIFVDSVKFLAHNNDSIFNKMYYCCRYSKRYFRSFLDSTREQKLRIFYLSQRLNEYLGISKQELYQLHSKYCDGSICPYLLDKIYPTLTNHNFQIETFSNLL